MSLAPFDREGVRNLEGFASFGPVNVPVSLHPTTMDKTLHFQQMEAGTADRIRYRKVTATKPLREDPPSSEKGFFVIRRQQIRSRHP